MWIRLLEILYHICFECRNDLISRGHENKWNSYQTDYIAIVLYEKYRMKNEAEWKGVRKREKIWISRTLVILFTRLTSNCLDTFRSLKLLRVMKFEINSLYKL